MEYHTPGVYIREVDSGPKPISSVSTSIPGFLGMFLFAPPTDAVAIEATDGSKTITGKVTPQLVDTKGNVSAKTTGEAVTALVEAFKFKRGQVRNLKSLLELNGHKPVFGKGDPGKTKIQIGKDALQVAETVVDA
jgi:phage tail sheath protein FI